MPINISGTEPPMPHEPDEPQKIPQWHPQATGENVPGLSAQKAVESMKGLDIDDYAEPHIALKFLCTDEWIEPFIEVLKEKDEATQTACWNFLASFGTNGGILQKLDAAGLKEILPSGEEIARKLLTRMP
ncbi:MAG: hypothetical protein LLF94_00295 [Chlamydiales bacterium]|nr:hypothetical protein [Chlamydiales bacterium]